jgi:hypothetical protein
VGVGLHEPLEEPGMKGVKVLLEVQGSCSGVMIEARMAVSSAKVASAVAGVRKYTVACRRVLTSSSM